MRRNGHAFNPRKQQRDSEIEGKTTRLGVGDFQLRRSKRSTLNAQHPTLNAEVPDLQKVQKLIQLQRMLSNVKSLLSGSFDSRARGNQMSAIARIVSTRSMPRKGVRLRRLGNFQEGPE
jgi:hypothetical protein